MDEDKTRGADWALEVGKRLSEPPSELLVGIAFAEEVSGQAKLSGYIGLVDLAHTLTLTDTGAIPSGPAKSLIAALLDLHAKPDDFLAEAARGDLYTNREVHLDERCEAVGWLGTARARREALITAYHLHLRDALLTATIALSGLGREMARLGSEHSDDPMPDYTYLQAAQPTSFGHYISGFSWPVLRDLERLQGLYSRVDLSPAGCGSMNGSIVAQDRRKQARRLGFAGPVEHARDAMWQADLAIEAMSCAVACAVGLDRLAEDLMVFATAEFGYIRLSDKHCRASKIMPQKRNPFALAYIRGLANRLIGEQAGVAASGRTLTGQMDSRSLPYSAVPEALLSIAGAARLLTEILTELTFDGKHAAAALDDGACFASDLAEWLCLEQRLNFRSAHGIVGRLVTQLEEQNRYLTDLTDEELRAACCANDPSLPQIHDGFVQRATNVAESFEARRDVGSVAPQLLRMQNAEITQKLLEFEHWSKRMTDHNSAAVELLLTEANGYSQGDEK